MSQLPSAESSSTPNAPSPVPTAEPGFEVKVQAFWNQNRSFILLLCVAALLVIVAREGWQYFSAMREKSIQEEYAQISDKPEKLASFAESHAGHPLAGVAFLQVADQKFEKGDYKESASYYAKAAGALKNEAVLGRAKVGSAVSLVNGGDLSGGEAALKTLAADQSLPKGVRAEASYHLASLAFEAGRVEDGKKLVEEVTKVDLTGPWAQRSTMLLAGLPDGGKPSGAIAPFAIKPQGQ